MARSHLDAKVRAARWFHRRLPRHCGCDPKPYLEQLSIPAIWLFGGADRNVPPVQSVAELKSIKDEMGKDWTTVVYPGAGYGLFDSPATDARAAPRAEEWVREHVHALTSE